MKKIVTMIFFSMMFLSCDAKVSSNNEQNLSNYQKAVLEAKENSKIVMLKLTSEDCHFCKKMDREVLNDKEVVSFLDKNFVLLDIDVKKEKLPIDLNYKVTPTFFFLTKDEKPLYRIQGAWHKKDFVELLEMVLKKSKGE